MAQVDFSENFTPGYTADDYEPNSISAVGGMIGKVAEQIIREVTTKDNLNVFDKFPVNEGDTIEQAVVKLVESEAYDPSGADALARKNPEIAVRYFKDWTRAKWHTTVDISSIRKVLKTGKGVGEISTRVVGVLNESDKDEKYQAMKKLLADAKQVADGGDADTVGGSLVKFETVEYSSGIQFAKVLTAMKNAVSKMSYVNSTCNSLSLRRKTDLQDIYVVIPYSLKNEMSVELLAGVFNLSETELKARIVEIDAEPVNGYNYIYIVDRKAILCYTRLYEMADQKNADGLFWNYFLHTERLYGISPLFDAGYIKVGTSAQG